MKYIYCEFPAFGNPIEIELPKEEALKRYHNKVKALNKNNTIISKLWFVGVQERQNNKRKFIIKNSEER